MKEAPRSSDTLVHPGFMRRQNTAEDSQTLTQAEPPSSKIMSTHTIAARKFNLTAEHDDLIAMTWLQDR
jgi:hypothetical protein